jgi:hypothetical protein
VYLDDDESWEKDLEDFKNQNAALNLIYYDSDESKSTFVLKLIVFVIVEKYLVSE